MATPEAQISPFQTLSHEEVGKLITITRGPIEKGYRNRGAPINEAFSHDVCVAIARATLAAVEAKNASAVGPQ